MSSSRIQLNMPPKYALIAVLVFTAACGRQSEADTAKAKEAKSGPAQTAEVHTAKIAVQEVSASVQATGSFAAQESSNVAPDSPGVILQTMAEVGDQVRTGQEIGRAHV